MAAKQSKQGGMSVPATLEFECVTDGGIESREAAMNTEVRIVDDEPEEER